VYSPVPFADEAVGPDGRAPVDDGWFRVFKGGSFYTPRPECVRIAFRNWDRPQGTNHTRGLRVARAVR